MGAEKKNVVGRCARQGGSLKKLHPYEKNIRDFLGGKVEGKGKQGGR